MNYEGKILLFEADITKEEDVNRLINKNSKYRDEKNQENKKGAERYAKML